MTPAVSTIRTVDVGSWHRVRLLAGGLLLVALGGSAVVAAIGDLTTDGSSTGVRVALGIIGVPFLAAGAGLLAWRIRRPPVALLDLDDDGLALRHRAGAAWHVAWTDVSSVRLVRARWRLVRTGPSAQLNWQRGIIPEFPRYFLWLRLRGSGAHRRLAVDLGPHRAVARQVGDAVSARATAGIERLDAPDSARVRADAQAGLERFQA